jgi:metal-sulfur cluster biosynthetic enzyme
MEFLSQSSMQVSEPEIHMEEEEYEGMCRRHHNYFSNKGLTPDEEEVWLLIRVIRDPEHPYTLAQLRVVSPKLVHYNDVSNILVVQFRPTIPKCSLSRLIGLCIHERVIKNFVLRNSCKLVVRVVEGSHEQADDINKQLADKERIAAALENEEVLRLVRQCITDN